MRSIVALLTVGALAVTSLAARPRPPADGPTNVSVTELGDGTLELAFDSPVLGRRVTALAWPPEARGDVHRRVPVAYFLHDRTLLGSARPGIEALGFVERARSAGYLVVAPDAGDDAWCRSCAWVDGSGVGVAAETHLWSELIPTVETHLRGHPGADRRAFVGVGMGATGALVQALRHPDRVSVVGAIDPDLDILAPDAGAARADLASQGHGPEHGLAVRNFNPEELTVNALATDLDLQIVLDTPSLHDRSTSTRWTQRGVPQTIVPASGPHAARYDRLLHQRLESALAEPARRPPVFSYRSASPAFTVWGWSVTSNDAPQGFTHLLSARTDGTGATLAGTGELRVATPPKFAPGSTHRVLVSAGTRHIPPDPPIVHEVVADEDGRLHVPIDLGSIPPLEERDAVTDALALPTARIWVADGDDTSSPSEPAPADPPLFDLDLPAPFDGWDVTVTAAARHGAYDLTFDSPALDRRVNLYVWLPDAYTSATAPTPVAYFLHGTGLGRGHVDALRIDRHLARQSYVVVAPDTQDPLWCRTCWWVDARDDDYAATYEVARQAGFDACDPIGICADDKARVDAETHLYDEVIPLTEAVLHVRADRGGRAVFGHSMGASAAAHHAVRHPDRWAFAGALSGMLDTGADKEPVGDMWASYLSHQGYPPDPLAGPRLRNLSAVDLASQTVGTGLDVTVTAGDGCLSDEPNCEPPSQANSGFFTELYVRQENDRSSPAMTRRGLGHVYHTYEGTHFQGPQGLPLPVVYDTIYVDDLNRTFTRELDDPIRFSHKFIEREFSVWGYDFAVERPNEEFVNILSARLDGRDLRIAGTGTVTIVTPPAFEPHGTYLVDLTLAGEDPEVRTSIADGAGRLRLSVVLGAPRPVDETEASIAAGTWDLPQTRIEVRIP